MDSHAGGLGQPSDGPLHKPENLDGPDIPPKIYGSDEEEEPMSPRAALEAPDAPRMPGVPEASSPSHEDSESDDDGTQKIKVMKLESQLEAARRAILRMNAVLAMRGGKGSSSEQHQRFEALMAQVGSLRRKNAMLVNLLGILAFWVALATGAVMSFVTPQSFEAWREGIAIQLIRRSPQTSLSALYARRFFGYFIERAFFEVPKCFLAALRQPALCGVGVALAFPTAALLRALRLGWQDDVALVLGLLLAAQVLFLADDFGLPVAPRLAQAGGFLMLVAGAVLTLPAMLRAVHRPKPWAQYRTQILHALTHFDEVATNGGGRADAGRADLPHRPPSVHFFRRAWLTFSVGQKNRRLGATANELAVLVAANAAVWMIDTLIVHD